MSVTADYNNKGKEMGEKVIKMIYLFQLYYFFLLYVQVIRTPETSDETFSALESFGKAVGKTTVQCKVTSTFSNYSLFFSSLSLQNCLYLE